MISYQTGGGWYSTQSNPLRPYGITVLLVSIFGGIIGHFLVNVALAIPFILLNNGDYLAAIVPEGKNINSVEKNIETNFTEKIVKPIIGNKHKVIKETKLNDSLGTNAETIRLLIVGENLLLMNVLENFGKNWAYIKTETKNEEGWCLFEDLEEL